jgi:hypothetical protein
MAVVDLRGRVGANHQYGSAEVYVSNIILSMWSLYNLEYDTTNHCEGTAEHSMTNNRTLVVQNGLLNAKNGSQYVIPS